jgi:hypothetical protein
MNDKEETDAIRKIADFEWATHRINKEYTRATSNVEKIKRKYPVPENKLLKELYARLEELKVQRRKCLSDIKIEKHNEYKRKVLFRKSIDEIQKAKEELKIVSEKRNELFKLLNECGEKYGTKVYNAGYDLFKLERDNAEKSKSEDKT